jgi:cell division septum initiation protein DivIVA
MKAGGERVVPVGTAKLVETIEAIEKRSLPVALKGYDRGATDRLLKQVEDGLRAIAQLHEGALAHIRELEGRIADGEKQQEAITDALVVASKIRAESEREGKRLQEAAEQKADEIVNAANGEAEKILEDVRLEARDFEQRINDAGQLAQLIRTHLTMFLQSMLAEVERRNADSASVVVDLIARAGQVADAQALELESKLESTKRAN